MRKVAWRAVQSVAYLVVTTAGMSAARMAEQKDYWKVECSAVSLAVNSVAWLALRWAGRRADTKADWKAG